jgi:uncharacterized protein (TIGR00297 family)
MSLPLLVVLGLALNAAAALLALWRGAVDPGGAAAGTIAGTLIFACGGPLLWLILMIFFVSSTALGMVGRRRKEHLGEVNEKGGRRDALQVLANGGMGMATAVLYGLTGNPGWAAGFAVSFASSNADTWGSELGVLSRREPVSLLTFRRVPRGISGGVSVAGSLASLAGAALIAAAFAGANLILRILPGGFLRVAGVVAIGGFCGSLIDSVLGATLQAQYAGPGTTLTERRLAEGGTRNTRVRGVSFFDNDMVNFVSCAAATIAAVLLAPLVFA